MPDQKSQAVLQRRLLVLECIRRLSGRSERWVLERKIKDVFLLDHLDCGAYNVLHPDCEIAKEYSEASLERMRELHEGELSALAWRVHEFCEGEYLKTKDDKWRHIRVSCFLMDLRGHVTQIEVPDGQRSHIER